MEVTSRTGMAFRSGRLRLRVRLYGVAIEGFNDDCADLFKPLRARYLSALGVGDSVHVQDVKLPAGTRFASKENVTLLSIVAPTVSAAEPAAEAPAAAAPAAKK